MSPMPVENTLMSTRRWRRRWGSGAARSRVPHRVRRAAGRCWTCCEGAGRLVIDLSGTRSVDSAGLGALMLIQRKAAERRQTVCLRAPTKSCVSFLSSPVGRPLRMETGVS